MSPTPDRSSTAAPDCAWRLAPASCRAGAPGKMREMRGRSPVFRTPWVELRAFVRERDLPLVGRWLRLPHVARWWGRPEESEQAVRDHREEDPALICMDDVPVGYLCWQYPPRQELETVGLADLPGDVVDIDIFIGRPDATGRGVGPMALSRLCHRLRRKGVTLVGIAASPDNRAACRAYESGGFQSFRPFREASRKWNYLTKALPASA